MATETTNLHLIKPDDSDSTDQTPFNSNSDILDNAYAEIMQEIQALKDRVTALET
jgi:hypothetical protein